MWFKIKVKHSWLEGPRHILTELGLVQTQEMQVILEYLHGTSTVVSPLDCDDWATWNQEVLGSLQCSILKQATVLPAAPYTDQV